MLKKAGVDVPVRFTNSLISDRLARIQSEAILSLAVGSGENQIVFGIPDGPPREPAAWVPRGQPESDRVWRSKSEHRVKYTRAYIDH
jgi:hypothetical protein